MPETQWLTSPPFSSWDVILPSPRWDNEAAVIQWAVTYPETRWDVGYENLIISHLSTEYINVPVQVTKAGASYNPTGDVVEFAFMPTPTQVPGNSDWVAGQWETDASNILYPYIAQC